MANIRRLELELGQREAELEKADATGQPTAGLLKRIRELSSALDNQRAGLEFLSRDGLARSVVECLLDEADPFEVIAAEQQKTHWEARDLDDGTIVLMPMSEVGQRGEKAAGTKYLKPGHRYQFRAVKHQPTPPKMGFVVGDNLGL